MLRNFVHERVNVYVGCSSSLPQVRNLQRSRACHSPLPPARPALHTRRPATTMDALPHGPRQLCDVPIDARFLYCRLPPFSHPPSCAISWTDRMLGLKVLDGIHLYPWIPTPVHQGIA